MKEDRVPSDVIKAIFHFLGVQEEHFRFPAKVPQVHFAFYELAQESDISILFDDFIFDTSKMFPYCETVNYALDRLQKANLLECINPGLDEYQISEKLSDWGIEETKLFDSNEIVLIKKAAEEFKNLVKA